MLWQRVESAVGQLKHHLGGDGPLSQSDQLALANHPLRMEAGPVTDQEPLHKRKLLQARELADHIARRILEARPAKARAVERQPPALPRSLRWRTHGYIVESSCSRQCTSSELRPRQAKHPHQLGKNTVYASRGAAAPTGHREPTPVRDEQAGTSAAGPRESSSRRCRLPDGSRGSTAGRGCSPSVETHRASPSAPCRHPLPPGRSIERELPPIPPPSPRHRVDIWPEYHDYDQ